MNKAKLDEIFDKLLVVNEMLDELIKEETCDTMSDIGDDLAIVIGKLEGLIEED